MTIQPGMRLGAFEIVASIGAGGMGEVYRARDTRLERTVAIKVLPSILASDPEFRARFEREARSISSLNHPHICTLHDVGEATTPDGAVVSYLVMEHLEGETLAARLAKGPLPLPTALEYGCQIAEALDKAHRQGIIHRDLKPANVFLLRTSGSAPGACKLLDFGLAKMGGAVTSSSIETQLAASRASAGGRGETGAPITSQGTILGTFQYMAPEQIEGQEADARSDIWAFGCVLYEMLTGRRAFEGRSQASLIASILERQPQPLAELVPMTPPALDRLVRTCLEKDPADRFHSAHDLRLQLQWIREGGSAAGLPAPVIARRHRRDRLGFAAVAVALAIASAAAAWWLKPAPVVNNVVAKFSYELPDGVAFSRIGRRGVAISPDGTRIAFIANQQIYLRNMRDLDPQPIRGSEVDPLDLTFSPDGEWLAFLSPDAVGLDLTNAKLRKIPTAGGTPLTLAASGATFGISWEESGRILFANQSGVHVVPESGGEPEALITLPSPGGAAASQPQLINEGRDVLFTLRGPSLNFNEAQIVVEPRGGGTRRVLVPAGNAGRLLAGGILVYAQSNVLMAQQLDPATLQPRGGAVPVLEGVRHAEGTGASQYSLSANGTLVFVPGGGNLARDLVWVNRKGVEEPVGTPPGNYRLARLSPDGSRIAYSSGEGDRDIWIWEIARKTLSRLTTGPQDDNYPVWTRDSRAIIYRSNPEGRTDVFRRAADGTGEATRLTSSDHRTTPLSLLPGSAQLLVRSSSEDNASGALSVLTLDPPGAMKELIPEGIGRSSNGEVSPDGRWLAYQSRESSTRDEISVRPMQNPQSARWQVSSGGGARPLWAPSGRELIYDARGTLMSVQVIPVAAGAPFASSSPAPIELGNRNYDLGFVGRPFDISLDGQRFLIPKIMTAPGNDQQSLRVITHWRDDVEAALRAK